MSIVKHIDYANIDYSMNAYYFGWTKDELSALKKQYLSQYYSKYYGNSDDICFEITDNNGNIYYAIFRAGIPDTYHVTNPKSYLLFKDQNRLLINVGHQFYRFLIKENAILDDSCYNGIICDSQYLSSKPLVLHEVMIIVDDEGIAAINWDGVLWKEEFYWASAGYLRLMPFDSNHISAEYYDPAKGCDYRLVFNMQNGSYKEVKL